MNCRFCGTQLVPGAMFCGECGRSVTQVEIPITPRRRPQPPGGDPGAPAPAREADAPAREADAPAEQVVPEATPAPAEASPAPADAQTAEEQPAGSPSLSLRPHDTNVIPDVVLDVRADSAPPRTLAQPLAEPTIDEQFVLQFSTGESVVVIGSGLIGRNPAAEPGEYVEHLVPVFDVGKSVSKSHVEFGQENGRFWVSDRYSTNGTLVREPGAEPVRCVPGRRHFIARGTRVEIGDQFFVVS